MSSLRKSLFSLAGAAVLLLFAGAAHATDYYANVATGRDSYDGLAPAAAFKTIQKAINTAAVGDTIHVAAGTYRESLVWADKDLTIEGAGAGQSIVDAGAGNGGPGGRCLTT